MYKRQELLNALTYVGDAKDIYSDTIAMLRVRLSAPERSEATEPKPVAWMVYTLDGTSVCVTDNPADFTPEHKALPLYTDPFQREWVKLTDTEIACVWNSTDPYYDIDDFARAIEAKLKEKNT